MLRPLLPALVLLASGSVVLFGSANAATSASVGASVGAPVSSSKAAAPTPVQIARISTADETANDGPTEPYLYGAAIAIGLCAWRWRQQRRHEQGMA